MPIPISKSKDQLAAPESSKKIEYPSYLAHLEQELTAGEFEKCA